MGTLSVKVGTVAVDLLDDDRICIGIKTKKPFEPDTLARWAEVCQPGVDVIDVGAYSGLFSIAAAKLGAVPVAIEPLPDMIKRIKVNAAANDVAFEVIEAAASDHIGVGKLGYNPKVHLTSGASLTRTTGASEIVRLVTLDSINVRNLSAIKIDVEHHEVGVLRGALKLIARERPILFIEVLDETAKEAVKRMLPKYRAIGMFDNRNMILEPR